MRARKKDLEQIYADYDGKLGTYVDREVALLDTAARFQYAGASPGALTRAEYELCLAAARTNRFRTLVSHLNEIETQRKRNRETFGD